MCDCGSPVLHDIGVEVELFGSDTIARVAVVVTGKDRPATMTDPAEVAEIELYHVKLFGFDILPGLDVENVNCLVELCKDELKSMSDEDY